MKNLVEISDIKPFIELSLGKITTKQQEILQYNIDFLSKVNVLDDRHLSRLMLANRIPVKLTGKSMGIDTADVNSNNGNRKELGDIPGASAWTSDRLVESHYNTKIPETIFNILVLKHPNMQPFKDILVAA